MDKDGLRLPRSAQWPELRAQWLRDHPTCAACGGKKNIEVHHKVPVHVARSMELDPDNLITLCESKKPGNNKLENHCHLQIGHLGNWYNYNRNVDRSAHDALLATYPKQLATHHAAPVQADAEPAPVFKPATPKGDNPAKAPEPTASEVNLARPFPHRRR